MKTLRFLIFLIFTIYLVPITYGQELANESDNANEAFDNLDYAKAIPLYLKLINKNQSPGYFQKLGICYFKTKDYEKAMDWLKKTLTLYPNRDEIRFLYADAIQHTGNYKFALSQYQIINSSNNRQSVLLIQRIQSCKNAIGLSLKPTEYKIFNDSVMNTSSSEFSVSLIKNGILFSSDRVLPEEKNRKPKLYGWTNTPYLNLFQSNKKLNGKFTNPTLFSEDLKSFFHTSNAVLSFDQKTIYFTRTELVKNPRKKFQSSNSKDFVNRIQIFYANFIGGKWSLPKPFPFNKVEEYSVGHPALSLDGKYLYFASDMPGGKGGVDLYYSALKNGTFTKPVNLGDSVNTSGDEEFPVCGLDHFFYFSSNGHQGLGGLDVFKVKGGLNNWKSPHNLGSPVNSSMDDFGFLPIDSNSNEGFFSSNRPGGKGGDDIYQFKRIDTVVTKIDTNKFYEGRIINATTRKGISDVNLSFNYKADSFSKEIITDSIGNYRIPKVSQDSSLIIKIKKTGFFTKFDTLYSDKLGRPIPKLSALIPIIVDKPIRLENIYYNFNSWIILPQAAGILNGLVKVLKDNPEIDIDLDSHTDTRGDRYINKFISQNRAQSAVDYLISQGIGASRLKARGFGKDKPLIHCDNSYRCTEEDHQKNRRTEFRVTKVITN
jgi:outer membrane protein OmpA-like peptidoglycan-associated protein/tetratricopeptide (TPR) repeat protein